MEEGISADLLGHSVLICEAFKLSPFDSLV